MRYGLDMGQDGRHFSEVDTTSRIPLLPVATPTSLLSESDLILKQASHPPIKRRRVDPRPGVMIREQASLIQQATLEESQVLKEGPSVARSSHEAGSYSAPGGRSPPQPMHDAASERISRLLVQQDFDYSTRAKGISIGEGSSRGADPSISELKINLGGLTAGYYDLKNKLIVEFGDKFKTTVEDPKEAETYPSAPTNTSEQDPFVNPPPVNTTTVVDQFET
ncbi:unnamed protein product [Lactuca saligna]|uniref:Uncharacterized protein n=1 Tax=Lactuca saligna TaxID=75948 RepID=A0AA36A2H1_LACSI|nr:unnamed protein product [Lactuca saligna]